METNFYKSERVALFIDGAHLHAAARTLSLHIDFKSLLGYFKQHARLVRALYYTGIVEDQDCSSIRPLVDWLDYNGFTMVTKSASKYASDNSYVRSKISIDVELTIDALRLAPSLDHVVIFGGTGDYRALVAALQESGCRVSVISTIMSSPTMIADVLRRQADQFIDLADLADVFARDRVDSRGSRPAISEALSEKFSRDRVLES